MKSWELVAWKKVKNGRAKYALTKHWVLVYFLALHSSTSIRLSLSATLVRIMSSNLNKALLTCFILRLPVKQMSTNAFINDRCKRSIDSLVQFHATFSITIFQLCCVLTKLSLRLEWRWHESMAYVRYIIKTDFFAFAERIILSKYQLTLVSNFGYV